MLVLMLYVLNIRIIMKIWYTVKYSTERAFQYMDKLWQTSIGMPILEIDVSAKNLYREFSRPCCFSHLY